MAGFKQSVMYFNPVCFLTFDGDSFDDSTYDLAASPLIILDESGFNNHAIFQTDGNIGHRMGTNSLVALEQADQFSISLGFYGTTKGGTWPKTILEVTNTNDFNFNYGENYGSFSVSLMYLKQTDESQYRTSFTPTRTTTLTRPIFAKGDMVKLNYVDYWAQASRLELVLPDGQQLNFSVTSNQFYGDPKHLVFVWDVKRVDFNTYEGTGTLYMNGRIILQKKTTYSETYPDTYVSDSWTFGGSKGSIGSDFNDRNTLDTRYDQIAVIPKALTHDQVCWLFKKTRSYENLVLSTFPTNYWVMDDLGGANTSMTPLAGTLTGTYFGVNTLIQMRQSGPPDIPGAVAPLFREGGCAIVQRTISGRYDPVFDPTGDYTIDFWFIVQSTARGILISLQRDSKPFNGVLIEVNKRNNQYAPGSIQINVTDELWLNSLERDTEDRPYDFADARWHHCAIVRRENKTIELWLDGILHSFSNFGTVTINTPGPGQLYIMGMMPGLLWTQGQMCHLSLNSRALDGPEIRARVLYSKIYKVSGRVTVRGTPARADIRIYSHLNGELIRTVESNVNDGEYIADLYDNRRIDLMILNKLDPNVRYRAFGPIAPSEYDDFPIT